jgi:hypothetical protein
MPGDAEAARIPKAIALAIVSLESFLILTTPTGKETWFTDAERPAGATDTLALAEIGCGDRTGRPGRTIVPVQLAVPPQPFIAIIAAAAYAQPSRGGRVDSVANVN